MRFETEREAPNYKARTTETIGSQSKGKTLPGDCYSRFLAIRAVRRHLLFVKVCCNVLQQPQETSTVWSLWIWLFFLHVWPLFYGFGPWSDSRGIRDAPTPTPWLCSDSVTSEVLRFVTERDWKARGEYVCRQEMSSMPDSWIFSGGGSHDSWRTVFSLTVVFWGIATLSCYFLHLPSSASSRECNSFWFLGPGNVPTPFGCVLLIRGFWTFPLLTQVSSWV